MIVIATSRGKAAEAKMLVEATGARGPDCCSRPEVVSSDMTAR
jgi:hypothetical protein